jgi:hypothetical protein
MAGKVQIAASGFITEQLVSEPDFTYFSHIFSKHRHFAKETVKLKPDNEKDVQTGDHVEFTIPANIGDILSKLSISFSIPDNLNTLNDGSVANYIVDQFGVSIFEYIDLFIGDQLIDRITSDDINITKTTRTSSAYNLTNNTLHGFRYIPTEFDASPILFAPNGPELLFGTYWVNGQSQRLDEWKYETIGLTTRTIYNLMVDLPFYFNDRPKHGFPLCSIQSQELKLKLKLRNGKEVLFPVDSVNPIPNRGHFEWDYTNDHKGQDFPLSNFKLNVDVIHLDIAERVKLKSGCKDILIEQNQHNTFTMGHGIKSESYRLEFKNCVKELYFIAKKKYKVLTPEEIIIFNTIISTVDLPAKISTIQKPVPCIYMRQKYVTLTCDGIPILDDTTGSHQFLSACIPDIYHKQSPYESNLTMYSFALHPDNMEPSGDLNFSMIKDATIHVELSNDGAYGLYDVDQQLIDSWAPFGLPPPTNVVHVEKDIHIIAKSYNILRIKDGVGEILF